MPARWKWLLFGCVAALVAGCAGWMFASKWMGEDRVAVVRSIQTYRNFLGEVRAQRERRDALDGELADSLDRTLGSKMENVDSTVRVRLANMARECGLQDLSVSIMRSVVLESPAKRSFRRSGIQRAFREEPDFVEVGASMNAIGSIDEVVNFLHRLDAAPWLKRVGLVRIDPEGKQGKLRLVVQLSTIFVPGLEPAQTPLEPDPRWSLQRYSRLVASNPFALPIKPEPVLATNSPEPPPPSGNPRANWRLTGIVEGPDGIEAWLMNLPRQDPVEIRLGEHFDLFTLSGVQGDIATFTVGDETFRILVGSTLDRPLP
jgi:hypothetical protein